MSSYLEKMKNNISKNTNLVDPPEGGSLQDKYTKPEMSDKIPEDINKIENQIFKLKDRMYEVAWLIGKRLIIIRDKHLKDLGYTNISEYSQEKYDFSHTTTVRFIFIAKHFDRSSAQNFGYKLTLLQKLNEQQRKEYLEWMEKENPTVREIEQKIQSELKKIQRPMQPINLTKTKLTLDFKTMNYYIPKEKSTNFMNEIEELVKKYGIKI